ncbi:3535_t:CDS:2 [Scutellospora calospora]|uniref:3535_t:CDS:1 n=1 Tax=Scutellospora calospora TaxID=85575 RepID=A0ACA9LHR3_9GLOM|nr:3535_t:CDS:2 [Scutellospora calospora]
MTTYSNNSNDNKEEPTEISNAEERRLLRKIDIRIIPLFILLYTLCYLDRVNIGNAKLAHLEHDLNLTGNEYNWSLGIFFVTYVFFEVPSNIILIKIKPSIWISSLMVGWGVVMIVMAFVSIKYFSSNCGFFEAGLLPGVIFYFTKWYKRSEQTYRVGLFYTGCLMAGAFSGFLAYAIMGMDDFPETTTWLTEDERKIVIDRLQNDLGDITATDLDKYQIYEAFKDWVLISQLLSVPPFILGCFATIIISILSDRSGVRGPYLICSSLIAIVGYVLLVIPTSSIAIKYIGLCFVCMGLFSFIPVSIIWLANNLAGNLKRAVGSAIMIASGNAAGVVGSQLYQPQDAPAYKFGHITAILLLLFTIILTIVQYCLLNRANKLKIKYPERFLKGKSKEEAVVLGDKHPSFVYRL